LALLQKNGASRVLSGPMRRSPAFLASLDGTSLKTFFMSPASGRFGLAMVTCSSCRKEIPPKVRYVMFTCPKCSQVTLYRCPRCRRTSNRYICPGCGFTGP